MTEQITLILFFDTQNLFTVNQTAARNSSKKEFLRFALPTQRELREECINELNRKRELLIEKESSELRDTRKELRIMLWQMLRGNLAAVHQNEQIQPFPTERAHEGSKSGQAHFYNEPFQQFCQLNAYPSAAWYYPPQIMLYMALPFYDSSKLLRTLKTDTLSYW
ncbi:alpha-S1-casein-like [Dasypus novemcinctus]|uniref:alpha-S1-casein-like n=1 Tax=Dasypus novemcinctus TaxID=9361 RepID=UPI0039C8D5CD